MSTDISSYIVSTPDIRHGRPRLAGTGITIHRIAIWYKLGHTPEEIAYQYQHLTLAQVYAALAYYHANRDQIEAEIAADEAEANTMEEEFLRTRKTV
ncbi:MAG TPA: DUF433 domain-containing protein [Blastocatellia bacterium]|nr:DUF433 domain-containing protein [Blastocatellia bacterium]